MTASMDEEAPAMESMGDRQPPQDKQPIAHASRLNDTLSWSAILAGCRDTRRLPGWMADRHTGLASA